MHSLTIGLTLLLASGLAVLLVQLVRDAWPKVVSAWSGAEVIGQHEMRRCPCLPRGVVQPVRIRRTNLPVAAAA